MANINHIIHEFSRSGFLPKVFSGIAGRSFIKKSDLKLGKILAKTGILATISSVAWKAYKIYAQNNGHYKHQTDELNAFIRFKEKAQTNPVRTPQWLLLQAIISAAYADRNISNEEKTYILRQIEEMEMDIEEKTLALEELQNPMDIEHIIEQVYDDEIAIEVYTASLLVLDERNPQNRAYLRSLADGLGLSDELLDILHDEVAIEKSYFSSHAA